MKKLTVLAYSNDADSIVRKLMGLRCVEIRNSGDYTRELSSGRLDCAAQKAEAERRLALIREAIPALNKFTRRKKRLGRHPHRVDRDEFLRDGRAESAWKAVERTVEILRLTDEVTAERTRNAALMQSLAPWLGYDVPLNTKGSGKTVLILGSYPDGTDRDAVIGELEAAGAYVESMENDEAGYYVAVTGYHGDEDTLLRLMTARGFLRAALPEVDSTAQFAYDGAENRMTDLEAKSLQLDEELRDLADELDNVEILADIEATTVNVCVQKQKLATTRNCVLLEGWVPVFTADAVTEALSKFECACEIADPEEGEEPPVLLRNNRISANFEWVIGMYAYPRYGAFDPTVIMSVFYFLIFGLMFADVGYGLLLILGCFGGVKLLNPRPGLRRMMLMFGYCGISCVILGLVFGGWFGDLPTAVMSNILHLPTDSSVGHFFGSGLWFNPMDDPMLFLILSLGVGAVHLIAGMVVKFIILCRDKKVLEAVCTIVPYWVLFAGIDLLVPGLVLDMIVKNPSDSLRATLSTLGDYGIWAMIAGAVLIVLLNGYGVRNPLRRLIKGLGGIYGLVSYASDLLSYSRILALGLVAGVIAKVINLITMMGASGPVGFVIMLIVLIAGHGLNLAINVLGTFVHTSRLQYIEFFGKFYEDGGTPFSPAVPADQYTETN